MKEEKYSKKVAEEFNAEISEAAQGKIKYLDGKEEALRQSLVCIANIMTGEVIRLPREVAYEKFVWQKDSNWFFTHKAIYKQYLASRMPESKIPAPVFVREVEKEDGEKIQELHNVFVGFPSMKQSNRKSSCNKKGKYTYQHIKANTVKQDGEDVFRSARTIRHIKQK